MSEGWLLDLQNMSDNRKMIHSTHANAEETYVKHYFEHFHPSFPLLHRPTFAVSSTPKLLLKAVTVIGSLFSPNSFNRGETQAILHWRQDIWHSGQEELHQMVHDGTLLFCLGSGNLIKIHPGFLKLQ